ncbi:MAG: PKD domain-containing protein, partial [Candidatus Competibacterales bacterium]
DTDPYDPHIVIHSYPNQQDSVYTPLLGNASELTGASLQNRWDQTHKRTLKWVEESAQAGKPWVVANDEQGNANTGAPPDIGYRGYTGTNVSQDDIRHQTLWGNIMAGGAGVEYYFGYQQPCDDLDCEDYRSRDNLWDYNRHALRFFSENDVPFWAMDNCNGLIGNGNDNATPGYCLGQTGSVYAVYLAKGFADAGDLNLGNAGGGTFEVYWYDPRNGGSLQLGSVTAVPGSGTVDLGNPPSSPNQDWVVLVQRGDGTPLPNQAPNVNAGPNRSLTLPNTTTTLNGSVNDDGKPDGVLDIVWTQIAGPSGATLVSPMSPVTEVSFSQAGSYEFELFASDGELDTVDTVSVSVAEAGSSDLGFELVDADTDQVVKPLGDGETIDLNAYPLANFNVVLINTPSNTGSVRFTLSGAGSKVQVENVIPYAAIGNNGADYDEQPAVVGSYQLRAEVFGGSNASGTLLDDITLRFAFDDSVEVPNQDPVASIAANPTQGTAPLTLNFNASASEDSDGTIVNYAWAFGDGNRASGATTSHVYTTPGNYPATLTVTDDDGATASAAVAIDVAEPANQGPMANVSPTPTQGTAPLTVAFDASASEDSDGTIAAYAWSFGDGSSGTGATTNHVYTTPGNYTATLTVTDDDGATASAAVDVIVDAPAGGSEGDVVVAVNSGGPAFTAADGTVYSADQGSVGSSKTYNTSGSQAIAGTSDDVLYRSERYGKTFGYAFDVPPGNYQVELLLAEIYWNASGKRVFSATVEGESAVTDLDLHAEVGKFATYDVTVLVEVVDGTLNIDFTTAVNNAKLSAVVGRTGEPVEPPEPVEPTVELALIEATNGSTVAVVSDGATVDLVSAGLEQFSLSLLDPQTGTDSVDYLLKGPIDHSQVENISPYTLFGDQGGGASFTGRTALPGTYTLQVVEFAGGNASGEVLRDATLSFTFVEEQVVNQPPLILGDSFDVIWGESVLLDVLANDSDPDGDPLTLVALSDREGSLQGQVAIEDNQVRYTPPPGSGFGFDVFAYDVTDGSVVVEEIVVFVYLDDPQTVGDGVYAANANGNFAFEAEEALNVDEQTNWLVKTGADLISGHEAPSGNGYLEATQNSLGNPPNSPALVYAFEVQQDGFVRLNLLGSYQGNDPTEENDTWVGLKSPGGNFIRALDQEVPLDQKGGMYKSYQSGGKETQWRAANRNVDNNPQPIVMAVQGGQVYEMHLKSRSRGHQVDRVVVEFLQNRPGIQSFTSLGQIKTEPLSPLR